MGDQIRLSLFAFSPSSTSRLACRCAQFGWWDVGALPAIDVFWCRVLPVVRWVVFLKWKSVLLRLGLWARAIRGILFLVVFALALLL